MCGRFSLTLPTQRLIEAFELDECIEWTGQRNIVPGTEIPVIRQSPEGKRVLQGLHWGLLPHWVKTPQLASRPINARLETLTDKPYFREAFRKRRCLIPADGFYEWAREGKTRQPFYFAQESQAPMALAGLWESWTAPDGTILRTVCLITTEANAVMRPVHDRMPVILAKDVWGQWLGRSSEADIATLLKRETEPLAASRLRLEPANSLSSPPPRSMPLGDEGGWRSG